MEGVSYQAIEKLRGADNWVIWKFAVKNLLRAAEGAYEICIGDIVKPEASATIAEQQLEYQASLKKWDKADRAACQIIVRTLESKVMALLVACESARDMWVKLHGIFEQQTKQAAHVVQSEYFNFCMDPSDDMVTHIAKFEGLILRMQQLSVKPDASSITVKLLDTLPDEYESLRQAWWARPDDQQTFENLMALLTSEEKRRQHLRQKHDGAAALMASKVKQTKSEPKGGATESRSQQQRKPIYKMNKSKKMSFKCHGCGEIGHIRRNCPNVKSKQTADGEQAFISEVMNAELDNESWIVDTGATDHITNNKLLFASFEYFTTPIKINVGDNSSMDALGKGTIKFLAEVNGQLSKGCMYNVLYAPSTRRNLFAVTPALDYGLTFQSSKTECKFVKDGIVKARGVRFGQLFKMSIRVVYPEIPIKKEVNSASANSLQVWHERFGHQNLRYVRKVLAQAGIAATNDSEFCGACIEGKQHRETFKLRQQRAKEPGELIHADLCGPMECTSLGGSKYFVCFTCDYTRYRMIYFLKEKSETIDKIDEMLQAVKTQLGRSVKRFQCDGGREFENQNVRKLLKKIGVQFIITNPYTPEQNGCAERTNRTVVETARTMLLAKNLPKLLWAEAVNTAVYVLNRTGPSGIEGKSPYELFTGRLLNLKTLHVFGTGCYVHIPQEQRRKWDAKGQRGFFVGYSTEIDGFRVWLKPRNMVVRSKNVVFEPECGGKTMALIPEEVTGFIPDVPDEAVSDSSDETISDLSAKAVSEDNYESITHVETPKRTLRNRETLKPPKRLIEMFLTEVDGPKNYDEASTSPDKLLWQKAMEEELESLKENSTWTLVKLPSGRKPITNRWVYRVKYKANGDIDRYKARLVARGFSQREGLDYNETFSPVARFDTIRSVLSVAANEQLKLAQFDVKTAFLNGIIEEEIYMVQPEGFDDGSGHVCKLQKSLYGLKQSPRCWNQRFKQVLFDFKLNESTADPCLFYRCSIEDKLIVVLYVDDGIVAASKTSRINEFLQKLETEFKITSGPLECFLNILIKRESDGSIVINQTKYAERVIKKFNMEQANPVSTPIEKGSIIMEESSIKLTTAPYREAVGCLMYLAVATRPDITYAVSYVSQFLEKPLEQHWTMVKRIFKYLKGTLAFGIQYKASRTASKLTGYSDADYANDPKTRRSVSGFLFKYSGGVITWASKRQQSVTLSTMEAEYVAASEGAKEAVWLSRLFNEIALLNTVPVLFMDNMSAIKLAKNPIFHKRSKHVAVRYHFVRERVEEGQLAIEYVQSKYQAADILTKPIPRVQFEKLRYILGLVE